MTQRLTDSELEDMVQRVPSVNIRAALLSHFYSERQRIRELETNIGAVGGSLKDLEQQKVNLERVKELESQIALLRSSNNLLENQLDAAQKEIVSIKSSFTEDPIRLNERTKIVNWLNRINIGETVRAMYGKKLARQIEAGEYEPVE